MTPPPSLQTLIDTVQQDSPTDDVLDQLVIASATVRQLEEVNDALLGHFVDRCRRAGRSWSEISAALGVSKQAVHKRFSGPIADRLMAASFPPTFERFTARARSVLVTADSSARSLGHDHVHPEHLLIGLFAEPEGVAARVLAAMTVSQQAVEAALPGGATRVPRPSAAGRAGQEAGRPREVAAAGREAAGAGRETTVPSRLPYSPEAVAALRNAVAEALELGHNYVGTEHILLGLLRDPDTPAVAMLEQLGASPAEVKVRISEMLRGFRAGR